MTDEVEPVKLKMSNKALNDRMNSVVTRLKNSIAQSVDLLKDINETVEEMVEQNKETVEMCNIYTIWTKKLRNLS